MALVASLARWLEVYLGLGFRMGFALGFALRLTLRLALRFTARSALARSPWLAGFSRSGWRRFGARTRLWRYGRRWGRLRSGFEVRIRIRNRIGGRSLVGILLPTATAWTSAFCHLNGFSGTEAPATLAASALRNGRGAPSSRSLDLSCWFGSISGSAGPTHTTHPGTMPSICALRRAPHSHYCLYASTIRGSCPEG